MLEIDRTTRRDDDERENVQMTNILKSLLLAAAAYTLALPALAQGRDPAQQAVPASVQRGIPGAGHAALAPLGGSWRGELSIYGTMGRSPDLPPIVSHDIRTNPSLDCRWTVYRGHDRRHSGGTAILAPRLARIQQPRPPL